MAGYTLVRVAKRQDPEVAANQGATITRKCKGDSRIKQVQATNTFFKRSSVNVQVMQQQET
jgi:hypothetical protein